MKNKIMVIKNKITPGIKKFIEFIKYNYRALNTLFVMGIIAAACIIIINLPILKYIGNNVKYSFLALGIIIVICFCIVLKLIRDLIGILLFNKSERSVINKSSIKK